MCFAALLSAADASAGSILTPFNVIVSGGFTETSDDVGGGLAVGGNASVPGSFSIADNLNGEALSSFPGTSVTLIVAGTVTSGSFNLNAGDYYVPNGTVTGGTKVTSDPITFSTQFTQFQTESTEIANETATCMTCASLSGGVLTINVNTVGMNVIDLTQAQIQGANEINFQAGSGVTFASSSSSYGNAWVLLNIQGTSVTLNPNWGRDFNGSQEVGSGAYGAEDVLYNFYQATSITTTNAAIVGSVLAPWAAYTDTSGNQIDGSLIAASFTGPAEFHNLNFLGPAFTPEPAPLAGVGVGLIALALVLRRRARGDARAVPL